MTLALNAEAFGRALAQNIRDFRARVQVIRADEKRAVQRGELLGEVGVEDLLEHRTRRHVIDPMLRALGWDLGDPAQVTEEARSWDENDDRLYFDYLGLNRQLSPVLLVEAKGADADGPRRPRDAPPKAAQMSQLLSEALRLLQANEKPNSLLHEWVDWLKTLRKYVQSLEPRKQATLQRVVITSGQWVIVFTKPVATLITDKEPDHADIRCFVSFEDLEARSRELYGLLARPQLVDTLPLAFELSNALEVLDPLAIDALFRGVVVSTTRSGALRGAYPTRTVYPAVVLVSAGRSFAVVDFQSNDLEEPRKLTELSDFLSALQERGGKFEARALARLGRPDLEAAPVMDYPITIRDPADAADVDPIPGSTGAQVAAAAPEKPQLVRKVSDVPSEQAYLVVTGVEWFHKRLEPFGPACDFHSWIKARDEGVGAGQPTVDRQNDSFTAANEPQHCEHVDLEGLKRQNLCQVLAIETHLCCRACVFHEVCWRAPSDKAKLPCAT